MSQSVFYKEEINDSARLESKFLFPISFLKESDVCVLFWFLFFLFVSIFSELLCMILEANTIPK